MELVELPEVQRLSVDELTDLLENQAKFEQFFNGLSVIQNRKALNADIQNGNEEMAATNLLMKGQIDSLKLEISELTSIISAQKNELDKKMALKAEIMKQNSPQVLYAKLKEATKQAEDESEKTSESFKKGEMDLKQFLKDYGDQRKLYHMRKQKLDGFYAKFGGAAVV
eukprot:NODE_1861_length_730_cov_167.491924_g1450_i0.p1 GENE.NODE_1861_length_730_cov_167.491924_g1450_i0~~NODE_1861_length_730_cov_167.491924_g1450_i0.p1  ORF type:complete len:169 (-),score=43.86 NODE_1861_length_730_cov_167.491924_g1450_i0:158-664(-)